MNPNMNEKQGYRCNICYLSNKNLVLASCGCFCCPDCYKSSKSYINKEKATCISCSKPVNYSKTIDLNNKESVKKVEFIYDDPDVQLKKIIEIIKFQKLHKNKYIEWLEKKVEELTKENQKLKEASLNGRAEILMNTNSKTSMAKFNTLSAVNQLMDANGTNSNQFLDLKQIKKIEPKRPEKNSTKATKNLPPNNEYVKIDNLNAKTAEIMKSSPLVGNNFQNQNFQGAGNNANFNQRALINVNINNSNRMEKTEMTNYKKGLFKQGGGGLNTGNNPGNSNSGSSTMMNSYASSNVNNPYYQNQKRKYLEMTNASSNIQHIQMNLGGISNISTMSNMSNNYTHLQTPMNNMSMNDMYRTRKVKYN